MIVIRRISKDTPFFSSIIVIALPIILQNFVSSLVNIVDTIMVGNLGSAQIAAVGLGNQIFFILAVILYGVGTGGGVFTAQFWGKKDIAGIRKTVGLSLTIGLLIAALFTTLAILYPEQIIALYSKDTEVIKIGGEYLRIAALCYPFITINFVFMTALRSTEQVKVPMRATFISLSTNVVLNYILIFGVADFIPALGVVGAAIATVVSRIIETCYLLGYSYKNKLTVAGTAKEFFAFTKEYLQRFMKVASPVIINELFWSIGITLHSVIFARAGTDDIAAFNITGTVSQLTWVFFIGMGNAIAIIIGKKIGENNIEEAYAYAKKFQIFMPAAATVICILLLPISFMLPLFFKIERTILHQASLMLIVLMLTYPFKAFNRGMIVGVCRAGGDTIFAGIVDVIFLYAVSIPLGFLAALYWNFPAWIIYLFIITEEPLKTICGIARLRSQKWLNRVIE